MRRLVGCNDAAELFVCSSDVEPIEKSDESLWLDFFFSGMITIWPKKQQAVMVERCWNGYILQCAYQLGVQKKSKQQAKVVKASLGVHGRRVLVENEEV